MHRYAITQSDAAYLPVKRLQDQQQQLIRVAATYLI